MSSSYLSFYHLSQSFHSRHGGTGFNDIEDYIAHHHHDKSSDCQIIWHQHCWLFRWWCKTAWLCEAVQVRIFKWRYANWIGDLTPGELLADVLDYAPLVSPSYYPLGVRIPSFWRGFSTATRRHKKTNQIDKLLCQQSKRPSRWASWTMKYVRWWMTMSSRPLY